MLFRNSKLNTRFNLVTNQRLVLLRASMNLMVADTRNGLSAEDIKNIDTIKKFSKEYRGIGLSVPSNINKLTF